ncbi:MAG: hypothetical protein LUG60_00060 [Erysipelotrichaceae bacterium]|nr:hypothetical protein [Erysipelotrichaceae bacterium]
MDLLIVPIAICVYVIIKTALEEKEEKERELKRQQKELAKQEIEQYAKEVEKIISLYRPKKILSIQDGEKVSCNSKFINNEIVLTTKALKNNLINKMNVCMEFDEEINSILSCKGYYSTKDKYNYLNSQINNLHALKDKRNDFYNELMRNKIYLLNEDQLMTNKIKNAFIHLLFSKKCIADSIGIEEFILNEKPKELSLFEYKSEPTIIYLNTFYFCLFSNAILVFDALGNFSTALDPTAIDFNIKKDTQYGFMRNGIYTYQDNIDSDSKCISKGQSNFSWLHARYDGSPDLRYKDNYQIESRTDVYEYGIITINILELSISFAVSSEKAITDFEELKTIYIKKRNHSHNSIPELLLLLKNVSNNNNNNNADDLIIKYKLYSRRNHYFCKEIVI